MQKKVERKRSPSVERIVLGRRESVPGEFANVYFEVEVRPRTGESTAELAERASRLVAEGLRNEMRKRRLRPWWKLDAAESSTLDEFPAPGEAAP